MPRMKMTICRIRLNIPTEKFDPDDIPFVNVASSAEDSVEVSIAEF